MKKIISLIVLLMIGMNIFAEKSQTLLEKDYSSADYYFLCIYVEGKDVNLEYFPNNPSNADYRVIVYASLVNAYYIFPFNKKMKL